MNIVPTVIILILFIGLFILTINKISSTTSKQDQIVAKVIKTYSEVPEYTEDQLLDMLFKEQNAHKAAQAKFCLDQNYGFDCSGALCKCIIDTQEACNSYRNKELAKLSDPNISEEDSKTISSKLIYWDNDQQRCIETLKAMNSDVCDLIQKVDKKRDPDHIFSFKPPKLKNCTDYRCEVDSPPTCIIPDGYCKSRGMDHRDPINPYDSGDCYVNGAQYWAEQFLGEETVRCFRTGDFDCIAKSFNLPLAAADAFCSKVLDMEGGCGLPQFIPSANDLLNFVKNPFEIPKFMLNTFVGTLSAGVNVVEGILNKLGFPVGTALSDTFNSVKEWVSDILQPAFDIFNSISNAFVDARDFIVDGVQEGAVWVYNNAISPVIDAFEEVGNAIADAC